MSDALERLKKQNRPIVQSRDASLNSATPDLSESINIDSFEAKSVDTSMSGILDSSISESPVISTSTSEPQKALKAGKRELETKQSTLRLEAKVSKKLQSLCQKQGICREVLIEAMFEYVEASSEALDVVVAKAREKNEFRQEIANRRRAKSMMDKFG
jgi:hypothetical protein